MIYKGLKKIRVEKFKAFNEMPEAIELFPITILVGANSSGKTSIIQSLLLLKQTIEYARRELALKIDSPLVKFSHLCEATYGWPGWSKAKMPAEIKNGPTFSLEWEIEGSLKEAKATSGAPVGMSQITDYSHMAWLKELPENEPFSLITRMDITFGWYDGEVVVKDLKLTSESNGKNGPEIHITHQISNRDASFRLMIPGQKEPKEISKGIVLDYDRFFPTIHPGMGVAKSIRILSHVFWVFFRLPLEGLRQDIEKMIYLGPLRAEPERQYPHTGLTAQGKMDPSGNSAAEILTLEKRKLTHHAPFIDIVASGKNGSSTGIVQLPSDIDEQTLKEALNYYLEKMGFREILDTEGQWGTSYRVTSNEKATIADVGFGVSQILPLIIAGLRADWAFGESLTDKSLEDYNNRANRSDLIVLEQPEIHLHPAAQSRLAQFLVSMALSGRRFIIETHSDHLVRRFRGLIARAYNAEDELKLKSLINIVNFSYHPDGTRFKQIKIDGHGKFTEWPEGFMDDGANEEEEIFMAWTGKMEARAKESRN